MDESKDDLIERLKEERDAWADLAKRRRMLLQHRRKNVRVVSESNVLKSLLEPHWKKLKKERFDVTAKLMQLLQKGLTVLDIKKRWENAMQEKSFRELKQYEMTSGEMDFWEIQLLEHEPSFEKQRSQLERERLDKELFRKQLREKQLECDQLQDQIIELKAHLAIPDLQDLQQDSTPSIPQKGASDEMDILRHLSKVIEKKELENHQHFLLDGENFLGIFAPKNRQSFLKNNLIYITDRNEKLQKKWKNQGKLDENDWAGWLAEMFEEEIEDARSSRKRKKLKRKGKAASFLPDVASDDENEIKVSNARKRRRNNRTRKNPKRRRPSANQILR